MKRLTGIQKWAVPWGEIGKSGTGKRADSREYGEEQR